MMSNLINTPIFTTQKTQEEFEKDMKETTKRELEKLHNALKDRVVHSENKVWDENFLSDVEEDDNISLTSSSTSSSTKELIGAISGMKHKVKKNKKNKKQAKNELVENAVMVQKLKSEIEKLESRMRYKDLDMSNLNVENLKLQVFEDKFKLMEKILNNIQQKELYLVDRVKSLHDISKNTSREYQRIKLNEMKLNEMKLNETKNTLIESKFQLETNLKTLNQPVLTRLIMDKDNQLNTELIDLDTKIIAKLEEIKLVEQVVKTMLYFGGTSIAIVVMVLAYYLY